jgi:glycosyltransferase involved in cell wall biosynthesis
MNSLFIGNFGSNKSINGQVIKTKELFDLIKSHESVLRVDTSKLSTLTIFFNTNKIKVIYICLGQNGLLWFLPLIFFLNLFIFKAEFKFFLVGGWFLNFINKYTSHNFFFFNSSIYVESSTLSHSLNKLGLNSFVFPNFRNESILHPKFLCFRDKKKYKFCFVSRIIESKGVFVIIDLIKELEYHNIIATVDFFGPIDQSIKDKFNRNLTDTIRYMGNLDDSRKVIDTISNYDFTLLPTYYDGECIPGVLVESMMAGTPVIVTDFKFINEIVSNNFNGYIYKSDNFIPSVCNVLGKINDSIYFNMSKNSIEYVINNQSIFVAKNILKFD